jgi:PiT family inorganic phosphate transporter
MTSLLPIMAFSAQLASAVNVHIYTNLGVPVSTSHSIVGAIMGVGLLRGVKVVNMKIAREMMFCWLATPFVSGIIGFIVIKTVMFFAGLKN